MKIKIICGFRKDQEHSIDVDEVHKAFYLFLHPEQRGIFKNGLAIIGSQIQRIVPDWHGSMGWNPTYELDNHDWNEIRDSGTDKKLTTYLSVGREVAQLANPKELNQPLGELVKEKYPQLLTSTVEKREGKMVSLANVK